MNKLDELAIKYDTDKSSKYHRYTLYYPDILPERVNNLLEIGVGRGGKSLKMWRDYYPSAEIHGIDIDPKSFVSGRRIHWYSVDQSKLEELEDFKKVMGIEFDVIIDDGSHVPEDQMLTARTFIDMLALGGVYVIEDVKHPDMLKKEMQDLEPVKLITYPKYYSILLIMKGKK